MTIVLFFVLFVWACWLGNIIMGTQKVKIRFLETDNTFTIYYDKRTIIVVTNPNIRICTYKRQVGEIETITVLGGKGTKSVERAEHFISRYKTTKLVKFMFDFRSVKEPVWLMQFDPYNCKELSEIQMKLKAFLRK
jgi:hypothetical protein